MQLLHKGLLRPHSTLLNMEPNILLRELTMKYIYSTKTNIYFYI